MKPYLLGFDIGGTKCAVILGRAAPDKPEVLGRADFATEPEKGPDRVLDRLADEARGLLDQHTVSLDDVRAMGVSTGARTDSDAGVLLDAPNLPGWINIPVAERLTAALGPPARAINDANACALAEFKWGAGRGCRHMIFLTMGTGMGAGIILDGRLYTGANDLAGEVGHIRLANQGPEGQGKRGSFEGFCGGSGIAGLAQDVIREQWACGRPVAFCTDKEHLGEVDARMVADAARGGDPTAIEIMETVGRYLGRGLAVLVDAFNPERIVIGSIFARQQDLLWPAAQKTFTEEALPAAAERCRILPAELGEAVGDYASLAVAEYS